MPNKLFLHTACGPVINSSVRYADKNFGYNEKVLLMTEGDQETSGIICTMLPTLSAEVLYCPTRGVMNALRYAHRKLDANFYTVLCADNIYPDRDEALASDPARSYAVTRTVPPKTGLELDWYCTVMSQWEDRGTRPITDEPILSLTTPWVLRRDFFYGLPDTPSLTHAFSIAGVQPIGRRHDGWHDLGTMHAYARYWREQECAR